MSEPSRSANLSLGVKLTYGIGSTAFGVAGLALSTSVVTLYLNQVIGLPGPLVGFVIMISLVVDAFVDPMIGRWSDTTRSRWGRRHPFMYASAILCGVSFYFLWHAPAHWPAGALLAFMLLMLVAVRVSLSLYEIPSTSLAPELAPDYHDRTTLLGYRQFFVMIGAATMYVLLYAVFLRKDAAHPLGVLNRAGYGEWGLIAVVLMVLSILISTAATHHLIPRLNQPRPRASARTQVGEILTLATNPSLLVLMTSGLTGGVAVGMAATLNSYFQLHFWSLAPQTLAFLIVFLLPAGIVGTVLSSVISRRIGKKLTMILVLCVSLVSTLAPISLRLMGWMPPNGSFLLLCILFADFSVTSMLAAFHHVLFPSMSADVVEDNAVRTGVRSEGLVFAANGLLGKCTVGVGVFLGTILLELAHFPSHAQQGSVDPGVLTHLALLYLPTMAVLNATSIVILAFYGIDRTVHEQNLQTLREAQP